MLSPVPLLKVPTLELLHGETCLPRDMLKVWRPVLACRHMWSHDVLVYSAFFIGIQLKFPFYG